MRRAQTGLTLAATALAVAVAALVLRDSRDGGPAVREPRRAPVASIRLRESPATEGADAYSWLVEPGVHARVVRGRVLRDGVPLEGALIRLVSARSRDGERQPPQSTTDANGRFELRDQAPMTVLLVATAGGAEPAVRSLSLDDPTRRFDELLIELSACHNLVRGQIVDIDGTPIQGARLSEQHVVSADQGGPLPVVAAVTDESGAFDLCISGSGTRLLVASAPGYGTVHVGSSRIGEFVTIRMTAEGALTGHVVDREGHPVSGAMVLASRPVSLESLDGPLMLSAMSDDDGHFFIGGLSAGRYILGADHLHYETPYDDRETLALGAGETLSRTLVMQARFRVAGTALEGNRNVAGQRVEIDGCAAKLTQADGSFVTWCNDSDDDRAVAVSRFSVVSPRSLVLQRETLDLVIAVRGKATVTGRLVADGIPISGALIAQSERHLRHESPAHINTRSDEDGRFVLIGVESGTHALAALDPITGHRTTAAPVTVTDGETLDIGDLELDERAELLGHVRTGDGTALAGVELTLRGPGARRRDRTSNDGSFAFFGLMDGEYSVEVRGHAGAPVVVLEGGGPVVVHGGDAPTRVDVVVEVARGAIAGRVVYPSGDAAAGARVRLLSETGASDWETARIDGGFEFSNLGGDRYTVEAHGRAGEFGRLPGVPPGGGHVEVPLSQAGGIRGRLVGATAALVRADLAVDGVGIVPGLDSHVAQARDGAFELNGLAPGRYRVTAHAADAVAQISVVVRAGDVVDVSLPMHGVAPLRGRVLEDGTGLPLAGAVCATGTSRSNRTGPDGQFEFEHAPESDAFIVRCDGSGASPLAGTTAVSQATSRSLVEVRAVRRGASLGVRFDVEDGGVVVAEPKSEGASSVMDLLPGDRLLAVDGVRLADHLLACLAHLHLRPTNQDVVLTIERDGTERSVTVRTE